MRAHLQNTHQEVRARSVREDPPTHDATPRPPRPAVAVTAGGHVPPRNPGPSWGYRTRSRRRPWAEVARSRRGRRQWPSGRRVSMAQPWVAVGCWTHRPGMAHDPGECAQGAFLFTTHAMVRRGQRDPCPDGDKRQHEGFFRQPSGRRRRGTRSARTHGLTPGRSRRPKARAEWAGRRPAEPDRAHWPCASRAHPGRARPGGPW